MKVIGILRVKDEADLLPEVLENVVQGVDEIYALDDGSSDATRQILEDCPQVTFLAPKGTSFPEEVYKTQYLEKQVKANFDYRNEEVWVALLAGDLFWLNQSPREAATLAHSRGFDIQNGIAIDFGRWGWDEATDTWPNWSTSLRELCQWCAVIEELPLAWKVADYTSYKRLPWPRHFRSRNHVIDNTIPFVEHQGKRSPRYHQWKYASGSRQLPKINGVRATTAQFNDYSVAYEHGRSLGFWENDRRIPWEGMQTIDRLLEIEKMDEPQRQEIYRSYDNQRHDNWPARNDL
jgi:glycosyltransferase involved in cell wall biosynthesis